MTDEAQEKTNSRPHVIRRLYDWVLHWADTPYGEPALGVLAFSESSFFPIPPDVLLIALGVAKPKKAFRFALVCSILSVIGGAFGYLIGLVLWDPVGKPILVALRPLNLTKHERCLVEKVEGDQVTVRLGDETRIDHRAKFRSVKPGPDENTKPWTWGPYESELSPGDEVWLMHDDFHKALKLYREYDAWIVFTAAFTPIPYKVFTILAGLLSMNFGSFMLASVVGRSARFFLVSAFIYFFGPPVKRLIDKYFNLATILFLLLLVGGFLVIKLLVH